MNKFERSEMMLSIAIDGPAGAGKSTVAKAVSQKLGFIYMDTGALYRAIGLFAERENIASNDELSLAKRLGEVTLELKHIAGSQRVFLNGEDVSDKIRVPKMSMAASNVSALPPVRDFLLDMQRALARRENVIMDGRDIGTVVLPDADVKIFLTATPQARAERRYKEHIAKGEKVSYNNVLEDIFTRDFNDTNRPVAPMKQAQDAVLVDTSEVGVDGAVEMVLSILSKRGIG